jgi:diacylglycerol kinase family enzyme
MYAAPGAELDDGLFDVVWCRQMGKLRFLTNVLPKVFKGTHVENPEVISRRAREVEIESDRPFAVYADGEHLADLPASFRLFPRALRLIAPPAPA